MDAPENRTTRRLLIGLAAAGGVGGLATLGTPDVAEAADTLDGWNTDLNPMSAGQAIVLNDAEDTLVPGNVAFLDEPNTFTEAQSANLVHNVAAVQNPDRVVTAGTKIYHLGDYGSFGLGPNLQVSQADIDVANFDQGVPDLVWSLASRRLYTRSLILSETSDPPDLTLGRTGTPSFNLLNPVTIPSSGGTLTDLLTQTMGDIPFPSSGKIMVGSNTLSYSSRDSSGFHGLTVTAGAGGSFAAGYQGQSVFDPETVPVGNLNGDDLGNVGWRAYRNPGTPYGLTTGGRWTGRVANIYARAQEGITATAHGSRLIFQTTKIGTDSLIDRVAITDQGDLFVGPSDNSGQVASRLGVLGDSAATAKTLLGLRAPTSGTGHLIDAMDSSGALLFRVTSAGEIRNKGVLRLDGAAAQIRVEQLTDATGALVVFSQAGDPNPRFAIRGNGQQLWGSGSAATDVAWYRSGAGTMQLDGALRVNGSLGLFNTTPATKQTVTGSRSGGAALTNLLSALATYGLITDSTSS